MAIKVTLWLSSRVRRADIPVRSNVFRQAERPIPSWVTVGRGCGQECPRAAKQPWFAAAL
jgi:hypothetical protein